MNLKKLLKGAIFTVAILLGASICTLANAQEMPPIPIDQQVRIGKLDNGLTYYLRHNKYPEQRADFYIAQKVGSIQENPDQSGLAHFLEHMCFNGTTHFPGNSLIEYLETIGVKFGVNLNAYTSIDETVYNISNVPVVREAIVDSCLLILHDWSNDLLLEPKEIDKERGVITEEWRTRLNATQRFQEKMLPHVFAGTKYENCFPIGDMEIVNNFPYQTLRDYYEKWYRPDLQGIVVVGDIDVDLVEAKIKSMFADVPAQPNAAERIYYPVTNNKEPIIFVGKDKEQPNVQLLVFNKHEATPPAQKNGMDYLITKYAGNLVSSMLNERLIELTQTSNPPYIYAGSMVGDFFVAKTKGAFTSFAICNENDIKRGITSLFEELERIKRFGFTESEYQRAKSNYLSTLESAYNEREKIENENFVNQYVRHFLDNEPIPSISDEYAIMSNIVPNIPLEAINQIIPQLIQEDNLVVTLFGPDKEGLTLPTETELLTMVQEIKGGDLEAYQEEVINEPLLNKAPLAGSILKTEKTAFETTTYTLSNGVKVVVKPTDFKADEIRLYAYSPGGSSLFADKDVVEIATINDVATVGGLGSFSIVNLGKVLAGKQVSVTPFISDTSEGIKGASTPKDLKTMMELIYLTFTSPRKDIEAFNSYKTRMQASLKNKLLNPMTSFVDSIKHAMYGDHPRNISMTSDLIERIDYDKALAMYSDRFKDASDFTFILVGNIDLATIEPLMENYLAALPTTGRKESYKKENLMHPRQGVYHNEFIKKQENSKSSIFVLYNGKCDYNNENLIKMSYLNQILDIVFTETIREDEGGTYGVHVSGTLTKTPIEQFILQIIFDTEPVKKNKLMEILYAQIEKIAKEGPSTQNVQKVKEYMIKKHKENLKENGYWQQVLIEKVVNNNDISSTYNEVVQSITPKDIKDFAAKLFGQENHIEVIMTSPAE